MNTICFDTSGEILFTGLKTDTAFFQESINSGFKHSEHLLMSIEGLLKKAGIAYKDVNLIACTRGPGSFTGLRIGMSTAKGLSTGIGCPLVSVNTLDVLAYNFKEALGAVVPVLDARKKRYYSAIYFKGKLVSEYMDISPEKLFKKVSNFNNVIFCGPGAKLLKESCFEKPSILETKFSFKANTNPIIALAEIGRIQFEKNGSDPDNSGPFYIRLSDAELSK